MSEADNRLKIPYLVLISTTDYEKLEADLKAAQDEVVKLRADLDFRIARHESDREFDRRIRETIARQRDRSIAKIRRLRSVLDDCDP